MTTTHPHRATGTSAVAIEPRAAGSPAATRGDCDVCGDGHADPFEVFDGSPPLTWCPACLGAGLADCPRCEGYGAVTAPAPCPACGAAIGPETPGF